jgi:hypothetical protein
MTSLAKFTSSRFKMVVCRAKLWLNKGMDITGPVKYVLIMLGLSFDDVDVLVVIGVLYCVVVLIVGLCWYRYGFMTAEIEVNNVVNAFVDDVRKSLNINRRRR